MTAPLTALFVTERQLVDGAFGGWLARQEKEARIYVLTPKGGYPMTDVHEKRKRLKKMIEADEILLMPGVGDPLSARLAQEAGFDAVFVSGAVVANWAFMYPDVGLTTFTEMRERSSAICSSVDIPVFVDADTGYGNAMNVLRTVADYARTDAAGVMLEDQVSPKRCGHFEGKRIVPRDEMMEKVVAFRRANAGHDLALIGRTDAITVAGFEEAIHRGNDLARAGADLVFVEAPRDEQELREIPKRIDHPLMANMVEGGKTPIKSAKELQKIGYSAVVFPSTVLRAAAFAMRNALRTLHETGTSLDLSDVMVPWEERQRLVGLDDHAALESEIRDEAARLLAG